MKAIRFIRRALFAIGLICLFGAAGTDQHYTDMGLMPPESVDALITWGFCLMIPQGLHWLRAELRKKVKR